MFESCPINIDNTKEFSPTNLHRHIYPEVKFANTNLITDQLKHITEELGEVIGCLNHDSVDNRSEEFYKELLDGLFEELIDLHYSVETAIRICEKQGMNVTHYRLKVINKNNRRGYYQ